MSYKATNWAYEMPITGPQKPVLVALADMADESGTCFPGQERLAEMTGLSVPTVARAIVRLEARGLLSRQRRNTQFGYRTSDRYQLNLDVTVPESLPITLPTRQRAYKAESRSLPIRESKPTYQSDRAIEPSVKPPVEPSGAIPSKFCGKHPQGTDEDCGACGRARKRQQAWLDEQLAKETISGPLMDPACEHGYPPRQCPTVGCEYAAVSA